MEVIRTASFVQDFHVFDLQVFCIQHDFISGTLDFAIDLDQPIIAPASTELKIGEGKVVVGGFDAVVIGSAFLGRSEPEQLTGPVGHLYQTQTS